MVGEKLVQGMLEQRKIVVRSLTGDVTAKENGRERSLYRRC